MPPLALAARCNTVTNGMFTPGKKTRIGKSNATLKESYAGGWWRYGKIQVRARTREEAIDRIEKELTKVKEHYGYEM